MRIATWNINRCRPGSPTRAVTLTSLMAKVDADVWVLTETFQDPSRGQATRWLPTQPTHLIAKRD